jgi:hypothetical protein
MKDVRRPCAARRKRQHSITTILRRAARHKRWPETEHRNHRFSALPPLNPLSAVWRVYDIIVEMLALFAATAALISTRTRRAAEILRRAMNGKEGRYI